MERMTDERAKEIGREIAKQIVQQSRRRPPGADLVPYMQTLTLLVLSTAFFFWPHRSWIHRLIDLIAGLICFALHYLKRPLLALGLAVGYTVCASIPGSWASLDLPKFQDFKRTLKVLPQSDDEDCMVCYDSEHPLAELPCDHKCCIACLDLLAAAFQTTCPACRKSLFSANDELIYALHRASVASMAADIVLLCFVGLQDFRQADYIDALVRFGSVGFLAPFMYFYAVQMRTYGDEWWRYMFSGAKKTVWDFRIAAFLLASMIFASSTIIWTTGSYFS